jgi:hypothetical protein
MNPAYIKLAEYAFFGAIGGLIGAMAKSRTLTLPRIVITRRKSGEVVKVVDTGFLSAPFLGASLAMYFDTRPENAIAWGLACGFAGPSIITALLEALMKQAGFKIGGLPELQPESSERR